MRVWVWDATGLVGNEVLGATVGDEKRVKDVLEHMLVSCEVVYARIEEARLTDTADGPRYARTGYGWTTIAEPQQRIIWAALTQTAQALGA